MKKIKVQMLTEEAFAPFGNVIEAVGEYGGEAGMYNWYEKQAQVDGAETVADGQDTVLKACTSQMVVKL